MQKYLDDKDHVLFSVHCTRRFVLRSLMLAGSALFLARCERSYVRPGAVHELGDPETLLYPKQHLREVSMLLIRDDKGWAALSAQCSYDGCDLTFQEELLYCPCCRTRFTHSGNIVSGPATLPLPWYEIHYENNRLYADSGKRVKPDYRFVDPKLEELVAERRKRVSEGGVVEGSAVPEILRGRAGEDTAPMFRDYQSDNLDSLHRLPEVEDADEADLLPASE